MIHFLFDSLTNVKGLNYQNGHFAERSQFDPSYYEYFDFTVDSINISQIFHK